MRFLILSLCLLVPILLANGDFHLHKPHFLKHFRRGSQQKTSQQSAKTAIVRDVNPVNPTSEALDPNSQVGVYFLQNKTLLGYYNASAQTAALFNYSVPQALVISASQALYLDAERGTVADVDLTLSAQEDFKTFFFNVPNLKSLAGNQVGQKPSQSQLQFLQQAGLVVDFNVTNPIDSLSTISKIVVHDHYYSIRGILEGYGQFNFVNGGGAAKFAASSKGHEDTFYFVPGGVQGLYNVGGTLDIPAIMNADNGINSLVTILLSIKNSKLNSNLIFANPLLHDLQTLLGIALLLGGNENTNDVDRTLSLVYTLVDLLHHGANFNQLLNVLQAFANDRQNFHPLQVSSTKALPQVVL